MAVLDDQRGLRVLVSMRDEVLTKMISQNNKKRIHWRSDDVWNALFCFGIVTLPRADPSCSNFYEHIPG